MLKKYFIILLITAFIITPITPLFAKQFNPNYLISDVEFTDKGAFSLANIQALLRSKGGAIANYKMVSNGAVKTAAQIIWITCQRYNINPKLILVLLQKEQGLITATNPSQSQFNWATGAGVCDGCNKNDPRLIAKYRGFDKQIEWAAKKFKEYFDDINENGKTVSGWGPGITKTSLDRIRITPINKATAALYTYNPWVGRYGGGDQRWGGNSLLWKKWNDWFKRSYPDGSLLQAFNQEGVWFIQNSKKRPITSKATLYSRFDPEKIILVDGSNLDNYEVGLSIRFPNYSLLRAPNGAVYLLIDDQKRGITSKEVFKNIGFNPEEIIDVTWEDLEDYKEGKPITMQSIYPTGALLQNNKTGGVYFVEDGIKYPIWSKEILQNRFPNKKITAVSPEELDLYPVGGPLGFKDGELIFSASTPTVYVISNGQKLAIPTEEIFNKMGYKWSHVIKTSDKALEAHVTGQPLQIVDEEPQIALVNN